MIDHELIVQIIWVNMASDNIMIECDKQLIVSELLCYFRNKFSKLSHITLKSVIVDFYSAEDISTAKEILVDNVDILMNVLKIDKWPRPARRNKTDNRSRVEVDDILSVFIHLDENLYLDKLPVYVAVNVDNIPSSRLDEGELGCVIKKLDSVVKRIDGVEKKIDNYGKTRGGGFNDYRPPTEFRPQSHRNSPLPPGRILPVGTSWADLTALPGSKRGAATDVGKDSNVMLLSETDTDNDVQPEGADGFIEVLGKNAAKKRRFISPVAQNAVSIKPKSAFRTKPIFGKNDFDCKLKAAKILKKNRIFCVSNLSPDTTCEDLKSWVESCDIVVNSVFEVKTKFTGTLSFRVNIDANDSAKFMSDDIWSNSIIIRDWVFKPKPTEAA